MAVTSRSAALTAEAKASKARVQKERPVMRSFLTWGELDRGASGFLPHAAKADRIPRQARIREPRRLAQPEARARRVGRRLPRAAAEHVFLAVGGAARVLGGA